MLHLIGGRGRLGRALERQTRGEVRLLPRERYAQWWREGAADEIARHFEASATPGDTVCLLAGVLDPALPEIEHERVNFALPVQVMSGAVAAGMRVMTFGTVMEGLVSSPNRYVATKAKLGRAAAERAARGDPVVHLRIHTLYGGGPPTPFMFLGQMFSALRTRSPFAMSSGRQLREYHHVDDDAGAIEVLLGVPERGVIELSHAEPCSLRDLAMGVFDAFGLGSLLKLGALADPVSDNFSVVFQKMPLLRSFDFRPTLPSVVHEMRRLLEPAEGAQTHE